MPLAVVFPLVAPAFAPKSAARPFSRIDGREVFLRTVEIYTPRSHVQQRIVVVPPDDLATMHERFSGHLGFQGVTVAGGGSDWFNCVARALEKLDDTIDTVLIHDPCCPAVPYTLLDALEEALAKTKFAAGIVPILPTRTAFADVSPERRLTEYVEMSKVSEVQSPQIFRRQILADAYAKRASLTDATFVDDAELLMHLGHSIGTVGGSRFNQRIDSDDLVRLGKDLLEHLPKAKRSSPLAPFGEAEW